MKKKLALLMTALLVISLLTGCGATAKNEAAFDSAAGTVDDGFYYTQDAVVEFEAPMEDAAMPEAEEERLNTTVSESQTEEGAAVEPVQTLAEKIIYTGYIYMQTTDFDTAISQLEKVVANFGGFVQDSSVQGNARTQSDGTTVIQDRWAHYVLRIPSASFDEFMTRADGIGNVTSSSRSAQNVTSQYTDYEARLSSLEIQEDRLLDMLKQSGDLESLITLEARLSEVRYEIESIQRNLRNLDQKLAYSTVELELREVEKYTPKVTVTRTFGEKLADAFSDGWKGFVDAAEDFVLFVAESLLTLIFLAAVVVVVIVLIRKYRRKKTAKTAVTPPSEE